MSRSASLLESAPRWISMMISGPINIPANIASPLVSSLFIGIPCGLFAPSTVDGLAGVAIAAPVGTLAHSSGGA